MPAGRSANWNGRVQGGTDADNILGDGRFSSCRCRAFAVFATYVPFLLAYLKGLQNVNWEDGYSAMVGDIFVERFALELV